MKDDVNDKRKELSRQKGVLESTVETLRKKSMGFISINKGEDTKMLQDKELMP